MSTEKNEHKISAAAAEILWDSRQDYGEMRNYSTVSAQRPESISDKNVPTITKAIEGAKIFTSIYIYMIIYHEATIPSPIDASDEVHRASSGSLVLFPE